MERSGRRALHRAAALIWLLAITAFAAGSAAVAEEAGLRFSEILSSNTMYPAYADCRATDWIELENTSARDICLNGYSIVRADSATTLSVLQGITIPAGGRIVLIADGNAAASGNGRVHLDFKLPQAGCTLRLMDPAGNLLDEVQVPTLTTDRSYQRDVRGSWQLDQEPTPGTAHVVHEEPVALEQLESCPLRITEVMTSNASYPIGTDGACTDYLELYNSGNETMDLTGWHLSDDIGLPALWTFPEGTTIFPGEYLLVRCVGAVAAETQGGLNAGFRLSSSGCTILLTDPEVRCAEQLQVPRLKSDKAYSLSEKGYTVGLLPTPGYSNDQSGVEQVYHELAVRNTESVVLNELMPGENGDGWIELHNRGNASVDVSGWGLSKDPKHPRAWQLPSGTVLGPGEYMVIACTESGDTLGLATTFGLSSEGDYTVVLSRADGTIRDRVYVAPMDILHPLGRVSQQDIWRSFREASPGTANAGAYADTEVPMPSYSVAGGLFRSGTQLSVELSCPAPGSSIYYTTDGTEPTMSSSLYTGPIGVSRTTVVRSRAYVDGWLGSYINSQTYLYDVDLGSSGKVFAVSLVADPKDLTDPATGIMFNYGQTYGPNTDGSEPSEEKQAHIEIYRDDGSVVLSEGCGVQLHGQGSRTEPQQGFRIIAEEKYGCGSFEAALFSNRPYTSYQSFLLRASGQDWDKAHMRDAVLQKLAIGTDLIYQESEVCVLYINGTYWGLYYLRERLNATTICREEGWEGQQGDLDVVKGERLTTKGSNASFEELVDYVKNTDPTDPGFYDRVAQTVDIENYIRIMSIEIFVGNGDAWNQKRYRNANEDGRWHWVLFDLDWGFELDTDSIRRWLDSEGVGRYRVDNTLFRRLVKNPRFRDEFLTYFSQQLMTTFTTENLTRLVEEQYAILEPLMPAQLARWEINESHHTRAVAQMRTHCKERPKKIIEYFRKCSYLGLTSEEYHHYFDEPLAYIKSHK